MTLSTGRESSTQNPLRSGGCEMGNYTGRFGERTGNGPLKLKLAKTLLETLLSLSSARPKISN